MSKILKENVMFTCKVCSSKETNEIINKLYSSPYLFKGKENKFSFRQCIVCGFVFLANPVDEEELINFYKNLGHIQGLNNLKLIDIQHRFIISNLDNNLQSVLDVGCSDYDFLRSFNTSVKKYGNDVRVETERMKGDDVTYFSGKFEELNTNKKFELIAFRHILEHLVDLDVIFSKVDKVLIDNGSLYIEVPDLYYLKDINVINSGFYFEHVNYFSIVSLTNILNKKGFDVTDISQNINPKESLQPYGIIRCIAKKRPYKESAVDLLLMNDCFLSKRIIDIHFKKIIGLVSNIKKYIHENKNKKIAIFGAGGNTIEAMNYMDSSMRESIVVYIDNDPKKNGLLLFGKPIINPKELGDYQIDLIVIFAVVGNKEIKNQLRNLYAVEYEIVEPFK